MLAYIPYMDPMGNSDLMANVGFGNFNVGFLSVMEWM